MLKKYHTATINLLKTFGKTETLGKRMKYIQITGKLLIILGAIMLVYQIISGDGNFELTKSIGFIVFLVGLFTTLIAQMMIRKNKK